MIRKYKGYISDHIDVVINWIVLLYFVLRLIQHYTTGVIGGNVYLHINTKHNTKYLL